MKKILVGLDFSELNAPVLNAAASLSRAFGASIYLIHVVRYIPSVADAEVMSVTPIDPAGMQSDAQCRLAAAKNELKSKGIEASSVILETVGNPGFQILDEAKRLGADLIVVGSHGHGAMYHLLVGSTAELLIRKSGCPVLLIPPPQRPDDRTSKTS